MAIPSSTQLLLAGNSRGNSENLVWTDDVSREELDYMISLRPLAVTAERLGLDYGKRTADAMVSEFTHANCIEVLGVLNWPGARYTLAAVFDLL
jgi:hypothetical protein